MKGRERGIMGKGAPQKNDTGSTLGDWLVDRILRLFIGALRLLPYRWRVPASGWLMRRVIGPLARYDRRIHENLALIHPEMSLPEKRRIARGVLDNMGRTFIENYSTAELIRHLENTPIGGPGLKALEEARAEGRGVILVGAHFGNYEAARAALVNHGHAVGCLYRPARNRFFNRHYSRTMDHFGGPMFDQSPKGLAGFVRALKGGAAMVLLIDQHVSEGEALPFMGVPAATSTSAARMAMRHDALLIPFYAARMPDGLNFEITLEAPVAHGDPLEMTREIIASQERHIRAHPEQWFWVHRRWKLPPGTSPAIGHPSSQG